MPRARRNPCTSAPAVVQWIVSTAVRWDKAQSYLQRDRDSCFLKRLRIRRPTSLRSTPTPWKFGLSASPSRPASPRDHFLVRVPLPHPFRSQLPNLWRPADHSTPAVQQIVLDLLKPEPFPLREPRSPTLFADFVVRHDVPRAASRSSAASHQRVSKYHDLSVEFE
jgi:hypothetical protein